MRTVHSQHIHQGSFEAASAASSHTQVVSAVGLRAPGALPSQNGQCLSCGDGVVIVRVHPDPGNPVGMKKALLAAISAFLSAAACLDGPEVMVVIEDFTKEH
jgi:phenylpyruvate tautomerase PptA (4-oxalocrotonate tautomerase family)